MPPPREDEATSDSGRGHVGAVAHGARGTKMPSPAWHGMLKGQFDLSDVAPAHENGLLRMVFYVLIVTLK